MSLPIAATPTLRGKDARLFIKRFVSLEKRFEPAPVDPAVVRAKLLGILRQKPR